VSNEQNENNELEKINDSIEIPKVKSPQNPQITTEAFNKMDVEEEPAPIEPKDNHNNKQTQVSVEEIKDSETNNNAEIKNSNINEISLKPDTSENQTLIKLEAKETPPNSINQAETVHAAVANEIEMAVEQQGEEKENKNDNAHRSASSNDNKTKTPTDNDSNKEKDIKNKGKRKNSKIKKHSSDDLYGKDLAHDAVRFNNRVGTDKEKQELNIGDIYQKSYKRCRKEINYNIADSFKTPSANKKQQSINKDKSSNKIEKKDLTDNSHKDKDSKDSSKNESVNSLAGYRNNKKATNYNDNSISQNHPFSRSGNNETINLNEDESNEEEIKDDKDKNKNNKSIKNKKAKKNVDQEESENQSLMDSKANKPSKLNKKGKGKGINLSLAEGENEEIKRKEKETKKEKGTENKVACHCR
jgi:hypothetical protein